MGDELQPKAETATPPFADPAVTTLLLREFVQRSRLFERKLENLTAVNPTDRVVMEKLIENGPQSPTELAAAVGITPAAMTTSLDRLEQLGHTHRSPHALDRRKIVVTASPSSVELLMSEIMSMVKDVDSVTSEFTPAEKETISRFLSRVVDVYARHTA